MLGECHISFFILSSLYFYLTLSILGRYSDLGVSANLHISFYPPYKVAKTDAANNTWRKLRRSFPHEKHFSSYPAIKLGRSAVSKNYRSLGISTKIMDYLKMLLFKSASYSAFRFLTVDAYISAIPFYERNGFKTLLPEEDDEHTRTMYFDILSLDES